MKKAEYEKILELKQQGVSISKACNMLQLSYSNFYHHHQYKSPFDDYKIKYPRIRWSKELEEELCEYYKKSNGNLLAALEEYCTKHSFSMHTVHVRWYTIIKYKYHTVLANVGDKTLINTKNVHRNKGISSMLIQETTEEVKELLHIPVFDSTVTWSFKYIYKKGKRK
jgi:hypothetical protein